MTQQQAWPRLVSLASTALLTTVAPCQEQSATTAAARRAAWQQHRQMERESPFRDLAWRAVGPRLQGGRIESIAVVPGNPSTMYVGPGSGNLWKTVNGGLSWQPIFEKQPTFSIGDIAIAPSNPDVIWLGTGETQPRHSGYSYAGAGVFRSTDAGNTWRHVGLWETHHIGKVVVHPNDPDTAWVAAIGHFWSRSRSCGVFKTTDGGATWKHSLFVSERTGAVDVAMHPSQPDTLLAWAWECTHGSESGLHKSTDGGRTWKRIERGLPKGPLGRAGISIHDGDPRIVYLFVDDHSPAKEPPRGRRIVGASVYRSDDHGDSWRQVNEDDLYSVFTIYGWKFCDVRCSPSDPNELYILGNRAYRSSDGGRTFARIGENIRRLHDTAGKGMHLDHHDLWIDPSDPKHLVLGNDGGLFVSRDRGATWLHHNNLPIGEFYFVATDDGRPYTIYGGTQDNAALYGPARTIDPFANDPWKHVFLDPWTGGDAFVTLPDPTQPGIVYYEHQHGAMRRMDVRAGNVLSWGPASKSIRPRLRGAEPRLQFGWYAPFLVSHHDVRTLYAGGNYVLKSKNRGDDWQAISGPLADRGGGERAAVPFGTITMLTESRLRAGFLYAGTEAGSVWVTHDDGNAWKRIDKGLPRKWVSRLVASRHAERRAYVAQHGYRQDDCTAYLHVTEDFGRTWRSLANGLPAESIHVVREDPHDPEILYVGTDLGVYASTDRGASWHSLSAKLPTTPVHDLVIQGRENEIVIATHGRSVFVADATPIQEFGKPLPPARTTYKGRTIAKTMHWLGAPWLMRETREKEEQPTRMLDALKIRKGMTVCDLGCGNGYHTLRLARRVGPSGRVLAVDIQPKMLSLLKQRQQKAGLENIERILGGVADPKLPPRSCDVILCVDVYHEFSHPERMLAKLRRALKRDGLLVLVEFRAEDPKVPIKRHHKMSKSQVLRELEPNGFELAGQFDGLPWQHVMMFRRTR